MTWYAGLPIFPPQGVKSEGGVAAVGGALTRIKAEAERLEVMDKAAGVLAEVLYSDQLLSQIKEYRTIMLHVSKRMAVYSFGAELFPLLA